MPPDVWAAFLFFLPPVNDLSDDAVGLSIVVCSSHKVLIKPASRSLPGCPQISQVWKDSCWAASMRWRIASFAWFTLKRKPPNFSFTCSTSNWLPVSCSNWATNGSKSSHSRQRMSNQPSSWVKPRGIKVCLMSPPVLNQVGQRSTSFCSCSLRILAATSCGQTVRLAAQIPERRRRFSNHAPQPPEAR
jgi:hypothetical protein